MVVRDAWAVTREHAICSGDESQQSFSGDENRQSAAATVAGRPRPLRLLVNQYNTLKLNSQIFEVLFGFSDLADLSSDQFGFLIGAAIAVHRQLVLGPRGDLQFVFLCDQFVYSPGGRRDLTLQHMIVHQIVVHRFGGNLGHLQVCEFHIGKVLHI